jgi:F-type H+-transporting ATPase subunit epsilon
MKDHIKLTISTPEKEFYSGEVQSLNTESEDGRFGVLVNHVSMVAPLKPTVTTFIDLNGKELKAFTSTGVLRVHNSQVEILCDACEWPEDIDVARSRQAKERAEERLHHKDVNDVIRAENAVLRAIMRIKTRD